MRKYWKTVAIVAVIVLSLGTFYVNSAISAEQYPGFVVQTESGDAAWIKPLVLEGSFADTSSPMNYTHANLKITTDGTTYYSRSFLDKVIGQYPTVIKEYQDQYRTFMRGKDPHLNLFFEDKQYVAYADADFKIGALKPRDFKFQISILSKADEKVNSFTVEVPEAGEIDHLYVEDVQIIGDELHLITQNMVRVKDTIDTLYDEKHIYTINMANQKISSHEAISQVPAWAENVPKVHINVRLIGTNPTTANEHLIMVRNEERWIEDAESSRVEDVSQEIISYKIATKETKTIQVPDLDLNENQLSFFDGTSIYFTRVEAQELIITPYSLVDEKVGPVLNVKLSNKDGQAPVLTVKDGKLYASGSNMNSTSEADVFVADVKTGEILFKGKVALEDSTEENMKFDLYIHELFVR